MSQKASFSLPSILAILAALLSFYANVFLGILLAAVAFVFGVLGIIFALAPNTRGGLTSIIAVLLSFVGVAVALIRLVIWLVNLA